MTGCARVLCQRPREPERLLSRQGDILNGCPLGVCSCLRAGKRRWPRLWPARACCRTPERTSAGALVGFRYLGNHQWSRIPGCRSDQIQEVQSVKQTVPRLIALVRRLFGVLLLGCPSANAASIVNGGFESDFSVTPNWSVTLADSGTLQRVTTWTALMDSRTISPKEGQYFLLIKSDETSPTDTILWQDVTLQAGTVVSGWMAIDAYLNSFSYADNDYAEVQILSGSLTLFSKSLTVSQLNSDRSLINWQAWSWTVPADGTYTIRLAARDDTTKSGAMTWWGLFDGITVTAAPVPEPPFVGTALSGALAAWSVLAVRTWRKKRRDFRAF